MPFYYYLTLFACGVTSIMLAVVLSGISIRQDEMFKKYSTARWCLCVAFVVFGLANLLQVGMESDGKEEALTGAMMVCIGSICAMMFTMVALVFIRPSVVTLRNVMIQLAFILLVSAFLLVARFMFPLHLFYIIYYVYICVYVMLLAAYTYVYVKNYQVFRKQMMDFYEEDELLYRLRWIQWTFWSALMVGVMALLLVIDSHYVNLLLTCLFTAYFLFITISFINYQQYSQLISRAVNTPESVEPTQIPATKADFEALTAKIDEWVRQKKFAETDKSVEEIAKQLDTDSSTLREYFTNHMGEDFRSWRIRTRIEEAKRLLDENPSIKIIDVIRLTGFNDRPYFYRVFTKVTGMTVVEYRQKKQGNPS